MSKAIRVGTVVLATMVVLSSLSSLTSAQSTDARLGGTVSDATGALIPGVTVTARNVGTGIVNTVLTNETGTYQFSNLQTGTYEVSAELPGFQTQRRTDVQLGGAQQARLNFTLGVATTATAVEVSAVVGAELVTTSASIQSVLPDAQVQGLPLGSRDIGELLAGMAGTGPTEDNIDGNFGGSRLSAVNVTRDGMSVVTGRYRQGTLAATYISPDLVEEVRVTTGTVDAEAQRGSGQVAMVTRSGTNQFRGSAFWFNRNSALDAANWFNNFNSTEGDWENRNQYGVRLGGPIIRDKTFFFVLIDNQRTAIREDFVGTVLTNEARQGIFRFYPGADNRNALQSNATVDLQGNPVRPAGATGDLQQINLFELDPNRTGFDPTGYVQNVLIGRMPEPNDFTVGDGLNTAGIRFQRRIYGLDTNIQDTVDRNNRDQVNVRIDHYFNSDHKFSFIYTWENSKNLATAQGIRNWPNAFDGANDKYPRVYNAQLVSTLSPNVVNEFRWGYRLHDVRGWPSFYTGLDLRTGEGELTPEAQEAYDLLPKTSDFETGPTNAAPIPRAIQPTTIGLGSVPVGNTAGFGNHRGSYSPLMSFGNNLSWIRGQHSFKAGIEYRRDRTDGYNDNTFTPNVSFGAGNFPAPISSGTVPGLTSTNSGLARNTLYNLSGSIDRVQQGFDLTSAEPPLEFEGYAQGNNRKIRDWRAREVSVFFKDDWKVTPTFSLNLGVKWDWFGVPYESRGLAGRVAGGYDGVCGFSECGLVTVELVGKNSPNPDKQLFNDDWNNFAPAVGFSWELPGFQRSTIIRGGYGISYSGRQIIQVMSAGGLDPGGGTLPGLSGITGCCGLEYFNTEYWDLSNLELPMEPLFEPLSAVPLTDSRGLTMNMYEPDRVVPYIQNFTFSIQRELTDSLTLDVSYLGSKGTRLYNRLSLNRVDIHGTGFLDAFNVTRAGGDHPLFDDLLMGLNIPGAGVVDGETLTGSSALRRYTPTRANLANGSVGSVVDFLNRSPNVTGEGGGFIRNAGLPEDFVVPYPQFNDMGLNGNNGNSTYHSLQVQISKRLSHGFTNQTSYTWSKSLGSADTEDDLNTRDPQNRSLDKARLGFHRSHIITSNGIWELPFGTSRRFLPASAGWVQNLVGQWQIGGLFRWSSGAPLTLTAGGLANIHQSSNNTPHLVGELPELGIVKHTDGSRPTYFGDLTQVIDPARGDVTSADNLSAAYSRRAIVDGQGNLVLVNPAPGEVGSLGLATIDGPARFQLDMNLQKRFQLDESRSLEFRMDVTNVLNHPIFGNPVTDIQSATFGQITSASDGRKINLGLRLNF